MKNKIVATLMILTVIAVLTSCASTRKYGCPMASAKATTKFKA